MKLARNYRKIARKSQSFWINLISAVLGSVALGFEFLYGVLPVEPLTFFFLFTASHVAAAIFRLVYQPGLSDE